jgi:hypothetical protein
MKIEGTCRDVDWMTEEEFADELAGMFHGDYKPDTGTIEAGKTAIVGSAWNMDRSIGMIPKSKCAVITFDRFTKWYNNDSFMLLTDGKSFISLANEICLVESDNPFAGPQIEGQEDYDFYGVGM